MRIGICQEGGVHRLTVRERKNSSGTHGNIEVPGIQDELNS
jgi:hypothetical protein